MNPRKGTALALIAGMLVLGGSPEAHAAMNLCAATVPGQRGASLGPSARALVKSAQSHLGDAPGPLASLHTEGTLPHQGIYDQSLVALKDLDVMRDAALAWRMGGEEAYLKQVDRYLAAWVATYQPSYNPIDESHFGELIVAYDLTSAALSASTRAATLDFVRRLGQGYVAQIAAQPRPLARSFRNNWQSHRVKLIAMAAFTVEDRDLIAAAERLYLAQIANNIAADGTTIDFNERDALHYATYDLVPLVTAALAARHHGRDWFSARAATGASLQRALDWLVPYADGQQSHDEFVHSTVRFDATRRGAGMSGYAGKWNPQNANQLYYLAAALDPRYAALAAKLSSTLDDWVAVCVPLPP